MHRCFVPPALLAADAPLLDGDPFHHLQVLRLATGDELLLLDGQGALARCRIAALEKRAARLQVLERWRESESIWPLRLLQGLPKGEKMELILQKGVELGLAAFTPVTTSRSVPHKGKEERWEKIVREAARQSRRPVLPRLDLLQPLAQALESTSEELRLLLWEEGSVPLAAALPATRPADGVLLVGPEGGFAGAEAELAVAHGFVPVSLGRRILRTETAGFAVAAILQHRYGDLGAA